MGIAAIMLMGGACSRRNTTDSASPPPTASAPTPAADAPAQQPPPANSASKSAPAVPLKPVTPAVDLPKSSTHAADTAEAAEAWSDRVKSQLARLAAALANPASSDTPLTEVLTTELTLTDARSWTRTPLADSTPVAVAELGPKPDTSPPAVSPATPDSSKTGAIAPGTIAPAATTTTEPAGPALARLRHWLKLDTAEPPGLVGFKLFGIERNGTRLKTRQRLTARGREGDATVYSLIVADGVWETGEADTPPKLHSLTWEKIVQSSHSETTRPLFLDITQNVLGTTEAWKSQLRTGMNTWSRRLDRTLKPDFLGYHGIALGDVNGDDREDVYLCQPGGLPNLLLLHQPDGTLHEAAPDSGADWLDNSTGALLVDLDNDGDRDLAVATHRAFVIMENDGAAHFTLRTQLPELGLGYSPSAADIDLDGDLDLLVLRYGSDSRELGGFPTPHPFYDARNGGANVLLENHGEFRFVDATAARGLNVENFRFSFAASWEDFDNDGDSDVYIANDFGPNQLFRNDGGRFTDVSAPSGTQDWGFGMSATWADTNRDGWMDLYVSNMFSGAGNQVVPQTGFNPSMPTQTRATYLKMVRGNSLLRHAGSGHFEDVTDPMAEGFGKWAWGAKFGDFNNDGWEDIYVANGYISQPDKDDL